jgi:hypothetical protein
LNGPHGPQPKPVKGMASGAMLPRPPKPPKPHGFKPNGEQLFHGRPPWNGRPPNGEQPGSPPRRGLNGPRPPMPASDLTTSSGPIMPNGKPSGFMYDGSKPVF